MAGVRRPSVDCEPLMNVPSRVERKRWAQDAAKTLNLNAAARAVLEHLAFIAGNRGKSWGRSQDDLAKELGLSDRTIRRAASQFAQEGLITIKRQGQIPSEYIPDFEKVLSPRPDTNKAVRRRRVRSKTKRVEVAPSATEAPPQTGHPVHPDRTLRVHRFIA